MNLRPLHVLSLLLCTLFAGAAMALSLLGNSEELLDPARAFKTNAMVEGRTLLVSIDVADGYYLYKDKIKLTSPHSAIGAPELPDGVRKTDEFFGEVETYRGMIEFSAAIEQRNAQEPLSVTVQSQGCADIGVCYPPYSQEFVIEVPALAASNQLPPANSSAPGSFLNPLTTSSLNNSPAGNSSSSPLADNTGSSVFGNFGFGSDDSGILDPEVAFTVQAGQLQNGIVPVTWQIAEGHYLYRDKFNFELLDANGASISSVALSNGKLKTDEFFGEVEVNRVKATARLTIANWQNTEWLTLKAGYQGCADIGICYPPQSKELQIAIIPAAANGNSIGSPAADANTAAVENLTNTDTTGNAPLAEQDRLAASIGSGKRLTTILTFFGMGLLLTFTPCVLPMIPILSSIIVGSGEKIGTGRAFTLSLIYVLAMALTYTVAGVIVGLTGDNIQATLQHPYVLSVFAALFVFLAASMFGLFELQMPAFIQNRLTSVSNRQKSGSFAGVATMGFLSALIVGPCVTAPLVGALIYIGQTGDAVLGGAALFALSMGMGVPLLIIGTSFGKYLPTAGPWMDVIKAVFGVMLLGVAIWMLDRVIPAWATMMLSALLLIVVGMFMGAFDNTPADARGWKRVAKGFGYAAIVYGTLLIIGIATGNGSLMKPLNGLSIAGQSADSSDHVVFTPIKGLSNLEAALASAKSQNKPVILDFYADWCVSCKEMEAFTFTDPQVAKLMNQAVLLQADVTANDDADKALLKKYGIYGPPAIMIYNTNGVEQRNARVVGFVPAEKFARHLDLFLFL